MFRAAENRGRRRFGGLFGPVHEADCVVIMPQGGAAKLNIPVVARAARSRAIWPVSYRDGWVIRRLGAALPAERREPAVCRVLKNQHRREDVYVRASFAGYPRSARRCRRRRGSNGRFDRRWIAGPAGARSCRRLRGPPARTNCRVTAMGRFGPMGSSDRAGASRRRKRRFGARVPKRGGPPTRSEPTALAWLASARSGDAGERRVPGGADEVSGERVGGLPTRAMLRWRYASPPTSSGAVTPRKSRRRSPLAVV